jgi:hypothetical protein
MEVMNNDMESWRGNDFLDALHTVMAWRSEHNRFFYYLNIGDDKKIIDSLAHSLVDHNIARAGSELGTALFSGNSELACGRENVVSCYTECFDDAVSIYLRTGSLWYAEFVAKSYPLFMESPQSYEAFIKPLIDSDDFIDTIPEEFRINKLYKRNVKNKFLVTSCRKRDDVKLDLKKFYNTLISITDRPLEYIHHLGFANTVDILDKASSFRFSKFNITKKDMLTLASQTFDDDKASFTWLMQFIKMTIEDREFALGAKTKMDMDWIHANKEYPVEFIKESASLLDDSIISADAYTDKAMELVNHIHELLCDNKTHDVVSCRNNVVSYYVRLFGMEYRWSACNQSREFNFYTTNQMNKLNRIVDFMMTIPDDIWRLLPTYGWIYGASFFPVHCPNSWIYMHALGKTIDYLSSKTFMTTDMNRIYRMAIMSNVNVALNESFTSCSFSLFTQKMTLPPSIRKYIMKGIIPDSIEYFDKEGRCRKTQLNDTVIFHNPVNNRPGARMVDSIANLKFSCFDAMKEMPDTYDEFCDIIHNRDITGNDLFKEALNKASKKKWMIR